MMQDSQAINFTALNGPRIRNTGATDSANPYLLFPEKFLLTLTVSIGILIVLLSNAYDQEIDWDGFAISLLPGAMLLCLGCYLRMHNDMPRLAQSAIALGLYIGFSGVVAILIYLRFPISTPIIDPVLTRIDTALGYSWPGFVTALGDYPSVGRVLSYLYASSLAQLFGVFLVLSFLNRTTDLHRILMTGALSLLFAVLIWWLIPSLGPSAYTHIAPDLKSALTLAYDDDTSKELLRMAHDGNEIFAPDIIKQTLAFPSYHMVMTCLTVWFLSGTRLFWPAVLLNTAMAPAILAHGGHHFSDLLGGCAVFAAALWISTTLVPRPDVQRTCSETPDRRQ